jgi:spore cortex formation protein SpoVR/YcgB (stage V sporulation)
MPLFYKHWSFGKHFAFHEAGYRRGLMGLAYEIVINSSPCISYIMEENTATMQTLVMAHAAFGHNHFFKNNYLFKEWSDAEGILDYLEFAKGYIARCEERYGGAHSRCSACTDVSQRAPLSAQQASRPSFRGAAGSGTPPSP